MACSSERAQSTGPQFLKAPRGGPVPNVTQQVEHAQSCWVQTGRQHPGGGFSPTPPELGHPPIPPKELLRRRCCWSKGLHPVLSFLRRAHSCQTLSREADAREGLPRAWFPSPQGQQQSPFLALVWASPKMVSTQRQKHRVGHFMSFSRDTIFKTHLHRTLTSQRKRRIHDSE